MAWKKLVKIKGRDGKTPIAGVDFQLPKDGKTPLKGVDYFTSEEVEELKDEVTPVKGLDYTDGENGATGAMPDHEWKRTKLRFEKPNGKWGKWTELQGEDGARGRSVFGGGHSAPAEFPTFEVDQTAHGFVVGTPIYYQTAGTWAKAQATTDKLATAVATKIVNANKFEASFASTDVTVDYSGLLESGQDAITDVDKGIQLYLSGSEAGTYTRVQPSTSQQLFLVLSTTQGVYYNSEAYESGGDAISWGDITGTLSDQTDLQDALDLKADITDLSDYLLTPAILAKTADYVFNGTEENNSIIYVHSNTAGTRMTIDPSLFSDGATFTFVKSGNNDQLIYIDADTGNTVNGSQTHELFNDGGVVTITWKSSTEWIITNSVFIETSNISGLASFVDSVLEDDGPQYLVPYHNALHDVDLGTKNLTTNDLSVDNDAYFGGDITSDPLTKAVFGYTQIGEWQASGSPYAFFGYSGIDHSDSRNYSLLQNSAGKTSLNSKPGQSLSLKIGNGTYIELTSSGNTGLGTTTVPERLTVNGNIRLTATNQAIQFYNSAYKITVSGGLEYHAYDYHQWKLNGTQKMKLNSTGLTIIDDLYVDNVYADNLIRTEIAVQQFNTWGDNKFLDSIITNRFLGRSEYIYVTKDTVHDSSIDQLTDGSFEGSKVVGTAGAGAIVWNFDFVTNGLTGVNGFTYSSGYFYAHFYPGYHPETLTARVQYKDLRWRDMTMDEFVTYGSGGIGFKGASPWGNYVIAVELTITPQATAHCYMTEFEYHGTRMQLEEGGLFTKIGGSIYGDVDVEGDLTATDLTLSGDVSAVNATFSGNLDTSGGKSEAITDTKTASYTATLDDQNIPCNADAGDMTITLPANPGNGQCYTIAKLNQANIITIDANGRVIYLITGSSSTATLSTISTIDLKYFGGNNWCVV